LCKKRLRRSHFSHKSPHKITGKKFVRTGNCFRTTGNYKAALAPSKLRLSLFDKDHAALDGIQALADLGLYLDLAAKLRNPLFLRIFSLLPCFKARQIPSRPGNFTSPGRVGTYARACQSGAAARERERKAKLVPADVLQLASCKSTLKM
jgi:hypothetical protein